MTPFPILRREAKHDARHRQLAVLALVLAGARAFAEAPAGPAAQGELRAARLVEAALFARQAGAEEMARLEKIYAELDEKYPREAAVRNAHAEFLWGTGEPERAVKKWDEALALDPKNTAVLEHLAGAWLAAGDAKKSAAFYARAVESAPENAASRFALANVTFLFRHELLSPAQPEEAAVLAHALAEFAAASRLAPLNPGYARSYAETFYSLPKPDWSAALAAWRHFAEISPQQDFAQVNLARVHLKLGQKDAARACLEKVQGADFQKLKAQLSARLDAGDAPAFTPPPAAQNPPDFSPKPGIDEPGDAP